MPSTKVQKSPNNIPEAHRIHESELGQAIYSWRSISIEPLIEDIKSILKRYLICSINGSIDMLLQEVYCLS